MDVFDLAAKISLDSSPFEKGLDRAKGRMSEFGSVFKANIASDMVSKGFSAMTSGIGKAVGGLKNLVSGSTSAFGNYQQMVGGVQKLYGNMGMNLQDYAKTVGKSVDDVRGEYKMLEGAQNTVMKNAKNAYKTAGMSANQYMETSTQFSASLIKSLGGDTQKAADQTDVAMRAISDNFNTFGGNMEDVINAYKGFSKQNYTMLDNLKLGYGGTKEEMGKLIDDANEYAKSIGQAGNLSMNSFSDIVTAIDLIQQKQKIAGTTAREASSTLEGSMGQMQAAWENLKTSIGSGKDLSTNINNLVDTIVGYDQKIGNSTEHVKGYLDNLLPVVEQALKGIGTLVEKAAPIIAEKLPKMLEDLVPPLISGLGTLASTVIEALPDIVNSIETALSSAFGNVDLGAITDKVSSLISSLSDTIAGVLPDLISVGTQILTAIVQGLSENADKLLDGAAQIVKALGDGIIQNLPLIVDAAVDFLQSFTEYITQNKDKIQTGVQALVNALVDGIIELTPSLADAALAIVTALGGALIDAVPQIVEQLPTFIGELNDAIGKAWSDASPGGKAAIAAALIPMFKGGISDAISGVKDVKDFGGGIKDIVGKIFKSGKPGDLSSSKDSELFDLLDDLEVPPEKVSGLEKLGTTLGTVKDKVAGLGGGALDGLKTLGSSLGNIAKLVGGTALEGLKSFGSLLTTTVLPSIAGVLPALLPLLPVIAAVAAAIVGVIAVVKNWDKISKVLKAGWEALKGAAGKVFGAIKDTVGKAWDGIKSKTSAVWDAVKSGVGKVWDGMKSNVGKVFGGIKDTVGKAWDKIKISTSEKWGNIKSTVKKNGGGIKGVIKTAADGYLAPWKKGFEALDKASNGKLGDAVKHVQVKLKEMQAKMKANNAKMRVLAKCMVYKIKAGWSGIKKAGGDFMRGLWEGINNKVGWVVSKVKGVGKKVLKALKDFFKIKSPSRVMRDEIGVNLALGIAKGIEKGAPKATKASNKLADSIYKSLKKTTTKSVKAAYDATKKVSKAAAKGGKTKTVRKEVRMSQTEIDDAYIKATKKKVKELQDAGKMTDKQQAALWVSVSKRVKKGSTAYNTALNNVKKATAGTRKALLEQFQKGEEDFQAKNKKGREMTLAEQVGYWKTAKKYFKKNTDEWIEVQKTYLEKKKALQDAEKQANDDLKTSLTNAEKTYKDALQASLDKIKQRKQEILGAFSLFDKFDSGDAVSKSTLVDNLDSQVKALKDWTQQIAVLKKRTGDTTMFKEIQAMGVKGLNQVIALNTMTDDELKKYADTYHNRNFMAGSEAQTELAKEVSKDNQTALNDYMTSVNSAWNTYVKTMGDAGVKVTDLTKSVKTSVEDVGEAYAKSLDKMGVATEDKSKTISDTLSKSLKKLTKKTKKYGSDLMDNFIEGIESKEKDLSDTVIKSIAKQVKKYVGFSEPEAGPLSNFHTFAPDMIDLFTKGIEDNAGKIGQAFNNSLPIEDVSSRISQGMTIPATNNNLQIAGLPKLTPIGTQADNGTNNRPLVLNAVFKVGKTEFAKLVYELNKEETQRVGVSLATGAAY